MSTSISQLIPKILNYCAQNKLFNNEKPRTVFIRTSSIIKEEYYGKKTFKFIPLEIVIYKNNQYKYRVFGDNINSNYVKVLSFDDLVQIVEKEIPYISFTETKSRKLYQHFKYAFASVIRVETETKKFENVEGELIEYFPQSTYVDASNIKEYINKNNDLVKLVEEKRELFKTDLSETDNSYIEPVRTLAPVEDDD